MKKQITFIVALLLSCTVVKSQDFIIKPNGDEIKAKVLEVTQTEVKYKKFENPDGPTYSISKSELFMIKYENGSKDVFNEVKKKEVKENEVKDNGQKSNETKNKKFDIMFAGGYSVANIEDADDGLAWGLVATWHLSDRIGLAWENNHAAYSYNWTNGKYKFQQLNLGVKYKWNYTKQYSGLRLCGGLLVSNFDPITTNDYSYTDKISFDTGIGFNIALAYNWGIYLEKSHTIALNIDNMLGYGKVTNSYTESLSSQGAATYYDYGSTTSNYVFYNGKIGISVFY